MLLPQTEVLLSARRLARTFASAPDPRRQARLILSTLMSAGSWEPSLGETLVRFEGWLNSAPPTGELRARCLYLVGLFPTARS